MLADALEEGRAIGVEQGRNAFETNLPKLVADECGDEISRAERLGLAEGLAQGREKGLEEGRTQGREEGLAEGRELGRDEGRRQGQELGFAEGQKLGTTEGWDQGREEGFAAGLQQGRDDATQEYTLQRHAERNWQNYAKVVESLATIAEVVEAEPGQRELEAQLVSDAEALIEAAGTLQAAYADQAEAFNTIIADLTEALAARNFPAIRAHARALRNNLVLKGELFLQANQRIFTAFESLNN